MRPKTLLAWVGGVLMALAILTYAGDFTWFELRLRNAKPDDPLRTVTFYYATAMKDGKVEVFYDQPQTQTCVRSLFPHYGYTPCWRLSRSGIQLISAILPPDAELAKRSYLAGRGIKKAAFAAQTRGRRLSARRFCQPNVRRRNDCL